MVIRMTNRRTTRRNQGACGCRPATSFVTATVRRAGRNASVGARIDRRCLSRRWWFRQVEAHKVRRLSIGLASPQGCQRVVKPAPFRDFHKHQLARRPKAPSSAAARGNLSRWNMPAERTSSNPGACIGLELGESPCGVVEMPQYALGNLRWAFTENIRQGGAIMPSGTSLVFPPASTPEHHPVHRPGAAQTDPMASRLLTPRVALGDKRVNYYPENRKRCFQHNHGTSP